MDIFIQIQPAIFCENCKECGARPVIQQVKSQYRVLCPNDKNHYSTKVGLIDIQDWNKKNQPQKTIAINTPLSAQKAS